MLAVFKNFKIDQAFMSKFGSSCLPTVVASGQLPSSCHIESAVFIFCFFLGKAGNVRTGTVNKGMQKAPSPSSQGKVVQSLPSQQQITTQQQKAVVVASPQGNQTKVFINHSNITSSQQPIAQLKQQVAQQKQQFQQITLKQIQQQQQQQQQLQQQPQQQQHLQQQKPHINSQFIKQQHPIQPRLAPASFIPQQPLTGQNIIVKVTEPLKSPPNTVFVATEPRQNMQHTVCQKPQSNVV